MLVSSFWRWVYRKIRSAVTLLGWATLFSLACFYTELMLERREDRAAFARRAAEEEAKAREDDDSSPCNSE